MAMSRGPGYRIFLAHRKRYRRHWAFFMSALVFSLLCTVLLAAKGPDGPPQEELNPTLRHLLQPFPVEVTTSGPSGTTLPPCPVENVTNATSEGGGTYPTDLFNYKQKRQGAIILHFIGLCYMFVALAIVCDEFFVPALGVITEKLAISDDVAGATFMAAGGSAPEFFTSVIGVFIAQDNVGIGTIVGSATFNILCVLAFCTLFSKGILHLTWWPLFRDVSFYILALALVVIFFLDEEISWYEALTLFCIYISYCLFMKFNEQLEIFVKCRLLGQPLPIEDDPTPVQDSNHLGSQQSIHHTTGGMPGSRPVSSEGGIRRRSISVSSSGRRQSIPILHSGAMFRNGIVQLMVHTLDPLSELQVDEKMVQLQGMASVKVVLDRNGQLKGHINAAFAPERGPPQGPPPAYPAVPGTPEDDEHFHNGRPNSGNNTKLQSLPSLQEEDEETRSTSGLYATSYRPPPTNKTHLLRKDTEPNYESTGGPTGNSSTTPLQDGVDAKNYNSYQTTRNGDLGSPKLERRMSIKEQVEEMIEEIEEPLDITWPTQNRKRVTYVLLAPIVLLLWFTLPDVRKQSSRRWFPITFVGSILWIAFYSWLMVWWADEIGRTIGIPIEIMGLTILAAGTSIPDLITSVIVARKGLGDMAVSSSIGSNIFDVCVGLPIPWLLYFIVNAIAPPSGYTGVIAVVSKGLVCSVGMLFIMLIVLIIAIGLFSWSMSKPFGIIMLMAYCVFAVVSVMLETDKIACPLRVSKSATCI